MSEYDTTLRNPLQAVREFGRAVGAGLGLNINPVTITQVTGKRQREPMVFSRKYKKRKVGSSAMQATNTGPASQSTLKPSRYKNNLGGWTGRHYAKRVTYKATEDALGDKEQHIYRLVSIPWVTNDAYMTSRNGKYCDVYGVTWRAIWKIKDSFDQLLPLTIRWAILNPKENSGDTTDVPTTAFFESRSHDSNLYDNFDAYNDWPSLMDTPIFKDRYGVVQEGNFTLDPHTSGTATVKGYHQERYMKKFIPIRKRMEWSSNNAVAGSEHPQQNLFFVWWYCSRCDITGTKKYTSQATVPIEFYHERTTYFRDSKLLN